MRIFSLFVLVLSARPIWQSPRPHGIVWGLVLVAAGLLPTSVAMACSNDNEAMSITMRQGNSVQVSLLTSAAIASTQFSGPTERPGTAVRGAIVRYRDARLFAIDFSTRTFTVMPLAEVVSQRTLERDRLAGSRPSSTVGVPPPQSAALPRTLRRLSLTQKIQGVTTRAFLLDDGVNKWRQWYADGLPIPLPDVLRELALLQPNDVARLDNGDGDGKEQKEDRDQHENRNQHEGGHDENGPGRRTLAPQVAGRVLLRLELSTGSGWRTVLDTLKVTRLRVSESSFDPPSTFKPAARVRGSGQATESPVTASRPALAIERSLQSQVTNAVVGGMVANLSANPIQGPGPIMANPDAYLFYWGHAFQGHDSVLAALNESFARLYDTRYKQFLQEYSVTGGQLAGVFTDFGDPPSDVGAADFPAVIAFVINKSLSTSAPTFWYTVGGHDPIYVIFVVDDHNLDKASWAATTSGHSPQPKW